MPPLSGNVRSSTTAPMAPLRNRSIPLESSLSHSMRTRSSADELNSPKILAASPASSPISRTHSILSLVVVGFPVFSAPGLASTFNLQSSKKGLLALGQLRGIRCHEPQHLLLQL